jgi:predicted signal transduction protein with EAL and GGDEF domain
MQLPGTVVTVGVTMGSAIAGPDTILDRETLIGMADATMYAGKAQRRRNAAAHPVGQVALDTR